MKTANNKLFFCSYLFLLFFIDCKPNKNSQLNSLCSTKSNINFNADTLMFNLNVNDTLGFQEFMITRKLFVMDSSFGNWNRKSEELAFKYAKSIQKSDPFLHYDIYVITKNSLTKKLWEVESFSCDNKYYPILEAREGYWDGKNLHPTVLTVIEKNNNSLAVKAINFIIDSKNNWRIFSKESLFSNLSSNYCYCIDTTTTDYLLPKQEGYPKNMIIFHKIFDNYYTDMKCNSEQ